MAGELVGELAPAAWILVLVLHARRPEPVLGGRRRPVGLEALRRGLALGAELLLFAGLRAVPAAADDQRPRPVRMREAHVQGREPAHRQADDVRAVDPEMVEDRDDVVARTRLLV